MSAASSAADARTQQQVGDVSSGGTINPIVAVAVAVVLLIGFLVWNSGRRR